MMRRVLRRPGRETGRLPFANDGSSRFLPWIVGPMVYLAALALAAAMLLSSAGQAWRNDLRDRMTVQIMPLAEEDDAEGLDARAERALALLRAAPGVARAELLSAARMGSLLAPWFGPGAPSSEVPLPRLIDVSLDAAASPEGRALAATLGAAVPGAIVDDHGQWMGRLSGLVRAFEALAIAVLALVGGVAVCTTVFAARSGLAVHRGAVEVMHLIGAEDGYIARQFQARIGWSALQGGLLGAVPAAATLIGLDRLTRSADEFLPDLALSAEQWLGVALVPVVAAAVATIAARWTVLRALRRMG